MPYTLEDLDNALANSVGPPFWEANGRLSAGYSRSLMIYKAASQRWLFQMSEDDDARVIREAWNDLATSGIFKPLNGWYGEDEQ